LIPESCRILRLSWLDCVLALILLDWERITRQFGFVIGFALAVWMVRKLIAAVPERDRWYCALVWLAGCGLFADWAGLHYIVGAFLAGAALDARWFGLEAIDRFRDVVLLAFMPVFFLSTGLRTSLAMAGHQSHPSQVARQSKSAAGQTAGPRSRERSNAISQARTA
jgi:Sodium/hydrogen exchanger family